MDSIDHASEAGSQYANQLNKLATTLGTPVRMSFDDLASAAQRELKRRNISVIRVGNAFEVSDAAKRAFIRTLIQAEPNVDLFVPPLERPTKSLSRIEAVHQAEDQIRISEENRSVDQRMGNMRDWIAKRRETQKLQNDALQAADAVPAPPLSYPDLAPKAEIEDVSELRGGTSLRKPEQMDAPGAQQSFGLRITG